MSYIFKFDYSDKLINTVKNHPDIGFYIYNGSAYYNNQPQLSGAFSNNVIGAPAAGYVSLYEENVDRTGSLSNPFFDVGGADPIPTNQYVGANPPITPFIVKDGTRINFKTVSTKNFNTLYQFGEVLSTSYPLTASISKEYFASSTSRYVEDQGEFTGTEEEQVAQARALTSVTHLYALKNTLNHYQYLSRHYAASSSTVGGGRDLMASDPQPGAVDVGLLSIPSIFYGSDIKKGSLNLKFYVSGTLIGELNDERKNGELIQVGPTGSVGSGSVAGIALYNEGFVILTGSWDLSDGAHTELYTGSSGPPNWICFAQSISGSVTAPSSSFLLDFKGTSKVPTLTLFAHARKNMLNHSNNPTYLKKGSTILNSTGALGYYQRDKIPIKNIVSSSYNDPTGSFRKITYISQIGIYDENKNLLGVAKLANPVKKLEDRDITFKLKLDI